LRRFSLLVAVSALAVGGCASGGRSELKPQANVAESLVAQRDFRSLARAWNGAHPDARGRLEPRLRDFLARHPDDRRVRVVRVYLAWILAQRGKLDEARALVAASRQGPTGTARDFAVVAEAAILLREGKPDQALSVLLPLEGKIIDPVERFMFGEQQVLAALAAHRQSVAVQHMLEWLARAAPEDRDAVQGRVHELVQGLAPEPLESSLGALVKERDAGPSSPETSAARDWLIDLVCDRLARHALERADGELARRLLDSGVESFRRGARGASLARIAAVGSVAPQIAGRALGLVLSVQSSLAREHSAQVAAGIAVALGLPASASDPKSVQLVTSEDDGSEGGMHRALASLAGEGAAILVAAVDPSGAERAAQYADDADIPVILLAKTALPATGFAFSLGVDAASERATLDDALAAAGFTHPARVGSGGVDCDILPKQAGLPRFPVDEWKRDKVDGVTVFGSASCARDVSRELLASGRRLTLGLALDCGEVIGELDASQPRIAVGAGAFPLRKGSSAPASLTSFAEQSGRSPSWYAALGHDAAALAGAALASFALEHVDDARTVAELHRRARDELAKSEAELWTTQARGFAGQRAIQRKLGTVSYVPPTPKWKKH